MNDADVIEALRVKLSVPSGRHLYGILGTYARLRSFAAELAQARTREGEPFPAPLSVNRGVLKAIPDEEFRRLVEDEAKRPEPTAAHVAQAFERFLRDALKVRSLIVLDNLEILFAYNLELSLLRTLATDEQRMVVLLPGSREGGRILLYPDTVTGETQVALPPNLIASDHLWELS
jgi:hypothetical protein